MKKFVVQCDIFSILLSLIQMFKTNDKYIFFNYVYWCVPTTLVSFRNGISSYNYQRELIREKPIMRNFSCRCLAELLLESWFPPYRLSFRKGTSSNINSLCVIKKRSCSRIGTKFSVVLKILYLLLYQFSLVLNELNYQIYRTSM